MRKLIFAIGGLVLLLVATGWYFSSARSAHKTFTWLEPTQLTRRLGPGLFTRLKFRVLRLPGPFWRWYMSGREQILVETRFFTLTDEATQRAKLSSPCWTNQEGVRAWLLSPENLKDLEQKFKALPGVSLENSLRLTTYDGGQAHLSSFSPTAGQTMNLLPRVAGGSFDLFVGETWTGNDSSEGATNFTVACHLLLSNGGALVLNGATSMHSQSTNCWVIISPVAVDAQGKPKRL